MNENPLKIDETDLGLFHETWPKSSCFRTVEVVSRRTIGETGGDKEDSFLLEPNPEGFEEMDKL
jgi:hypothetical protein